MLKTMKLVGKINKILKPLDSRFNCLNYLSKWVA
jgi:hypothetical protein